jgi:hypothetical protein
MRKEYGEKKGKKVFYASKNAGKVTGVERWQTATQWATKLTSPKKKKYSTKGTKIAAIMNLDKWNC